MGFSRLTIVSTAFCVGLAPSCHAAASPMNILHADGLMAKRILPLTQALLIVSAVVVVIITALVLIAVFRRGRGGAVADTPLLESPGQRLDLDRRRPLHNRTGRSGRLDFNNDGARSPIHPASLPCRSMSGAISGGGSSSIRTTIRRRSS